MQCGPVGCGRYNFVRELPGRSVFALVGFKRVPDMRRGLRGFIGRLGLHELSRGKLLWYDGPFIGVRVLRSWKIRSDRC